MKTTRKINRLERRAQRALRCATEYWYDDDAEGEQEAMAMYREIQRKLERSRARMGYAHA